jgi:hypothetical protein
MPKRSEFVEHVVELMRGLGAVQAKPMFGAWGLFHEGLCFAKCPEVRLSPRLRLGVQALDRAVPVDAGWKAVHARSCAEGPHCLDRPPQLGCSRLAPRRLAHLLDGAKAAYRH